MPNFTFNDQDLGKRLNSAKSKLREQTASLESTLGALISHPIVDTTRGDSKHLQIRVPTAKDLEGTIITAGRRQEDRSYDGLGVITNRHIVMDARGGKENSTMSLQANGMVHLQSDDDSLYAVSKGPTLIASSSAVDVTGSGGVLIAGGFSSTVENPPITKEAPEAPKALTGFPDFMSQASATWKATDTALKVATATLDGLQEKLDPSYASTYTDVHEAIGLESAAKTALKTNNVVGEAQKKEDGSVFVHGAGGVFIDTPQNAVTRATKALVLSSDSTALLGETQVDVYANSAFSVTAGDQGRVYAGTQLRLVAHDDKVHIGARVGECVEVQAEAINIGETSPDDPQKPTDAVSLVAKKHAGITTDSGASHTSSPDGIHLDSHAVITGKAKSTITLEADEKLTVKAGDSKATIVVDSSGEVLIKASQATVTVNGSGGIKVKHQQATIEAATTTVTAKSGGSKVEIGPAGVTVKGSITKIG